MSTLAYDLTAAHRPETIPPLESQPDFIGSMRLPMANTSLLNQIADLVLVISLPHRQDRRDKIAEQLSDLGVKFFFFDAIRPRPEEIAFRDIYRMEAFGDRNNLFTEYVLGAVGCRRSHTEALRIARRLNLEQVLVLEDDCILHDGWEPALRNALEELPDDWDMLYLSARERATGEPFSSHLKRLRGGRCTTAILHRRRCFDYMIDGWEASGMEVDVFMDAVVQQEKKCYVVQPMITCQAEGFSDAIQAYSAEHP